MVRVAYLLVGSEQFAAEIVQDAFATVYVRWDRIDNHGGCRRQVLVTGTFVLDLVERTVVCPAGEATLTTKLFSLLELFMRNPGKTVTRLQIMQDVWHTDFMDDTRTLDVHMSWLRKAIEPNPRQPVYLRTRRGVGYAFYPNAAADKAGAEDAALTDGEADQ